MSASAATQPRLADGTPYVGELGKLAYDRDEDKVQCHLCGGWYRMLGSSHLRRTSERYRVGCEPGRVGSSGLPAMADDRVWRDRGGFLSLIAGWRALVR